MNTDSGYNKWLNVCSYNGLKRVFDRRPGLGEGVGFALESIEDNKQTIARVEEGVLFLDTNIGFIMQYRSGEMFVIDEEDYTVKQFIPTNN